MKVTRKHAQASPSFSRNPTERRRTRSKKGPFLPRDDGLNGRAKIDPKKRAKIFREGKGGKPEPAPTFHR
jgi:hypothetical protein